MNELERLKAELDRYLKEIPKLKERGYAINHKWIRAQKKRIKEASKPTQGKFSI